MKELVWFENPGWERHVIGSGFSGMINLAAADTDGDGIPEIVLAQDFSNTPAKSVGTVLLLKSQGDPRQPWRRQEIDRLPTSHRLRVLRGRDGIAFVNAPLAGAAGEPPEYRAPIPVVLYRPGVWEREPISGATRGVMHGILITDWDGDGTDDLLTASFEGIHLLRNRGKGKWERTRLSPGNESPWPKGGSSDVAVGRVGKQRFLAAIEPWHGSEVAVYCQNGRRWQRTVIDQSVEDGHTILAADFDGDGNDEIVAGFRRGKAVVLYRSADASGAHWERHVIDADISAAGCDAADFDGDGRLDLACIGSATTNLKLYRNLRIPGSGSAIGLHSAKIEVSLLFDGRLAGVRDRHQEPGNRRSTRSVR
jgi:hypothetical protein